MKVSLKVNDSSSENILSPLGMILFQPAYMPQIKDLVSECQNYWGGRKKEPLRQHNNLVCRWIEFKPPPDFQSAV